MYQIVYSSKRSENFKVSDIVVMLEKAQENNAGLGISGLLLFGNDRFLQVLEGYDKPVQEIYQKISQDDRHQDVKIITSGEIKETTFNMWKMSYIDVETVGRGRGAVKFFENFTPENMNADQAIGMLKQMEEKLHSFDRQIKSKELNVMVVDDSEIMGKLVKIGLKDSKYHITAFTEAKDALEEVSKGSAIDVILCDINMPDMDGFNFLSKVRASNAIVPVVYSSSDPPLDRLERALRAGADSYLPKPFKRDELYNAIRQALLSSELVKMEMMTF